MRRRGGRFAHGVGRFAHGGSFIGGSFVLRDSFWDDGDGDALDGALAAKMVALLRQRAAFYDGKRFRAFALHECVVVGEDGVD